MRVWTLADLLIPIQQPKAPQPGRAPTGIVRSAEKVPTPAGRGGLLRQIPPTPPPHARKETRFSVDNGYFVLAGGSEGSGSESPEDPFLTVLHSVGNGGVEGDAAGVGDQLTLTRLPPAGHPSLSISRCPASGEETSWRWLLPEDNSQLADHGSESCEVETKTGNDAVR